jgi:hypothetical protein
MEPYLEKLLNKTSTQKVTNKRDEFLLNNFPELKDHFPEDKKFENSKEYMIIKNMIIEMWQSGIIARGSGFCLSMSDMIKKILAIKGVPSEIIECDLIAFNKSNPSMSLIGHDRLTVGSYENIDSHVVCIAGSENKFIIDLSIFHFKDLTEKYFIFHELENCDESSLCSFESNNVIWNYNVKKYPKLPELHQKSILDRINTDKKIFSNISILNKFMILIFAITTLNFVRGIYDFNQKYLIRDNNFGPTRILK